VRPCYPRLPLGASGALVYRFTVPGELGAVRAVQVEAVDADGARLGTSASVGHRLDGLRGFPLGGGRLSLRPSVEVGLHRDGGDAETGPLVTTCFGLPARPPRGARGGPG
jgi:hypothetical protein